MPIRLATPWVSRLGKRQRLEQQYFSERLKEYLFVNYPKFLDNLEVRNDGSFDCSRLGLFGNVEFG